MAWPDEYILDWQVAEKLGISVASLDALLQEQGIRIVRIGGGPRRFIAKEHLPALRRIVGTRTAQA